MRCRYFLLTILMLLTAHVASAEVVDFSLGRTLKAGRLTGLCVPFRLEASQVGELYAVATIEGYITRMYAAKSVAAGQPCVVKTSSNISKLQVESDSIVNKAIGTQPLPWDGGLIEGQANDCSWTYITPEGKRVKSSSMAFLTINLQKMDFTVNLENYQLRRFLDDVYYDDTTKSQVHSYKQNVVRLDHPNPVSIPLPLTVSDSLVLYYADGTDDFSQADSMIVGTDETAVKLYNLLPQRTYYYELKDSTSVVSKGKFTTTGRIRMIYVPNVFNIRDLGGWTLDDGRQTVYGKLFRGSELNGTFVADSAGLASLRKLGVAAEIDLRFKNENEGAGTSPFGFLDSSIADADEATYLFTNNFCSQATLLRYSTYLTRLKNVLNFIVSNLRQGRPVYCHCIWGADRTGILYMLLEGLLGFSYDQIMKDYELTSFYPGALKQKENREDVFTFINDFEGATLKEKFNTFFISKVGVSQEVIDDFRAMMFGDEPLNNCIGCSPRITEHAVSHYYDLSGRPVDNGCKGLLIERTADGQVKKYFK